MLAQYQAAIHCTSLPHKALTVSCLLHTFLYLTHSGHCDRFMASLLPCLTLSCPGLYSAVSNRESVPTVSTHQGQNGLMHMKSLKENVGFRHGVLWAQVVSLGSAYLPCSSGLWADFTLKGLFLPDRKLIA